MSQVIEVQVGDEVAVEWKRSAYSGSVNTAKHDRGTVILVAKRLIQIRHPLGFTFSVSAGDLACGTRLVVTKRKDEEPMMSEFEALDRQVDEGVEQAAPEPESEVTTEVQTEAFSVPEGTNWREVMTRDKYLELKKAGKTDGWMAKACGVNGQTFAKWKEENGLKGVKLNPNGTLYFPEEEPVLGGTFTPPARVEPSQPHSDCGNPCGEACKCHPVKSDVETLSFVQASVLVADLEDEIECCNQLIESSTLTKRVFEVVAKLLDESLARLDRIKAARVVF